MHPTLRYGFALLLATALTACGINPVTGEREIQFVSEAQEIAIGQQNYAPMQQSEGGDLDVVPGLSEYVNEVGQKLAAVADRDLPYEFVVLNNSTPNAWALPGGKIAVNRGLLTELENEAELAAVLGHEIVHAAARHGAKAQERGIMMQAGMAAAQIGAAVGGVDPTLAGLALQGAGLGAQLVQMRYGREQELESDDYGMKYMKLAGYDPWGAVTLQEKFVRLAEQSGRQSSGWFEGLFASHPPSAERVAENKRTAARLGRGGELGAERYAARLAPLRKLEPAYDKYDEALAAARADKLDEAQRLASEAKRLAPNEARFHELLGEIALAKKDPATALTHYERAMKLDPDYFAPLLGAGVAQFRSGNKTRARELLAQSAELLPTAPAAYYLGQIEKERGNSAQAMQYFRAAAGSQSALGQQAAAELARLDLAQNPGNYVATAAQMDGAGRLIVLVENRAPVALADIRITPVLINANGQIVQQGRVVRIPRVLGPGERVAADTGAGRVAPTQLQYVRFRVEGATPVE